MNRRNARAWKAYGALFAMLAIGGGVSLAFDYDKTPGGANLIHADDAPGDSRIALTRNACSLDTSTEINAYILGIDEWRNVDRTPPLFEDRFFTTDCSVSLIDGSNDVALVRTAAIDGNLGLARRRCAVRDGIWRIVETDVLVATDVGSSGSLFFQQGTVTTAGDPPELSPENTADDVFGTYLHELGHAAGLQHQNGGQPRLMLSTGRIARVGDTRPANQPFTAPVWAAVLPDDRAGARDGYPSNRLTGLHLFASAQYWGPHLGEDFVAEANEMTIGNDFLNQPANMRTVDGDTGVRFAQVFAETFLEDPSRLSCGASGCTIRACAGEYVTVPYSIGNGAFGFVDELCHTFYVTDASGDDLSVLEGFYGRSSECGLRIDASFQSPGGFVTGVTQLKISETAPTGVFRLYHEIDTCQSAVACEFYGDVDPREYDNIVATDIFIRVESPAENPACPENPLDEPLGTYCLTPLDPISCTQDSDCEDIGMEIAMDYENQLGEKWDPLIEDYLCRPAVAPNSFATNPSFAETCQCPELPPEAVVP